MFKQSLQSIFINSILQLVSQRKIIKEFLYFKYNPQQKQIVVANLYRYHDCLKDLLNKSLSRVREIKAEIIQSIQSKFLEFEDKISENFDKEIRLFQEINKEEVEGALIKLKEQLRQKFEKFQNFSQQVSEFKVSPVLDSIDPLSRVPLQQDLDLHISSDSEDERRRKQHRSPERSRYICPICMKGFHERMGIFSLRKHLNLNHDMILRFQCPDCEFIAENYYDLTPHLFQAHGEEVIMSNGKSSKYKKYTCKFSGKGYQKVEGLSNLIKNDIRYHKII